MAVGLLLSSMVACTGNKTSDATCCNGEGECTEQSKCDKNSNCKTNKEMTYSKKYTNADFYKDGKFDQAVAIEAMKDMFKFYDVPFTELMAKDMWVQISVWVTLKTLVWVVFSGSTMQNTDTSLTLSICFRDR